MDGKRNLLTPSVFFIGAAIVLSLVASGCASNKTKNDSGDAVALVIRDSSGGAIANPNNGNPTATNTVNGIKAYVVTEEVFGKKLVVNHFDYPITINDSVGKWITYFTGKGRKHFVKYLDRGRYFIPEISRVLKQNNMPQDLVYLAMIESGFNNVARSSAKAVGPWQFMKFTGKRYGLTVDYWLDERRETRKATMAAIGYLRELYQEFGSWELAASGYNAGEGKVRRAIAKYKTNDFWAIAKKKFFKSETRNYVPKIIAAAIISKNPELYGFEDPFKKGAKPVLNPTTLMHLADGGAAAMKAESQSDEELTPKELESEISKNEDDTSEDPSDVADEKAGDKSGDSTVAKDNTPDDDDATASDGPVLSPAVYMVANPNDKIIEYEVKGPADLFSIAKAAGLPYSTVKLLNPEIRRWVTPPSLKTYKLKLPHSVKQRFLSNYNDDNFDKKVVFQTYTVRRGDNVQTVAKRFMIEQDPIRELNGMPAKAVGLSTGKSIMLPIPTGYKRVIASMYDEKPEKEGRRRSKRRRSKRRYAGHASIEYSSGYASAVVKARSHRLKPKFTNSTKSH